MDRGPWTVTVTVTDGRLDDRGQRLPRGPVAGYPVGTMAIFEDVSAQIQDAMRARNADRLKALRNIRSALLYKAKEDGSATLPDEVSVEVLRRLAKQRNESIEAYEGAGRAAQAAEERDELAVIEAWLPKLADEDQTRAWVEEAISATGASAARDVGRVMGAVMKAHKGEVDGALTRRLASELLPG